MHHTHVAMVQLLDNTNPANGLAGSDAICMAFRAAAMPQQHQCLRHTTCNLNTACASRVLTGE